MKKELTIHNLTKNISVPQKGEYFNITPAFKREGKEVKDFLRSPRTKKRIETIKKINGGNIPNDFYFAIKGGDIKSCNPRETGTFVHRKLIKLAMKYLSDELEYKIEELFDMMEEKLRNKLIRPHHSTSNYYKRMVINKGRVPLRYFSVLNRTNDLLVHPLWENGYDIPLVGEDGKDIQPDISTGKLFPKYLKQHDKYNHDEITYSYTTIDGNIFKAKAYLNKYIDDFDNFFAGWIINVAPKYFKKKIGENIGNHLKLIANNISNQMID